MSTGPLSGESAADVRTVAKGGAVQVAGQLASRAFLFAFVAVATRVLGVTGFGVYRQVFQILNVVALAASGGFNVAALRYIARARARGDHGAVRGAARVALVGAGVSSIVAFAVVLVGAEPIAAAFADSAGGRDEVAGLLRLGALYIPLFAVMQVLRSATQAYRTMVPSVMVGQIILPVGRLVLGALALLAGLALQGAIASLVIAAALSLVAAVLYFQGMMTEPERRSVPRMQTGSMVRFALPQAGVNLLGLQTLGLGVILLGILSTDHDVGLFSVALSLQGAGAVFLSGVVGIFAPVVVDLYERGETARLESFYQTTNRWIATFSFPVFAALIIVPELFLRLLTGGASAQARAVVVILAVGNIVFTGTGPCSYLISMTGRAGLNLVNSVAAVGGYLVLGLWLVPRYGVIGMAVTDALVTSLVNLARVVEAKVLIGVQPFGRSFAKPVVACLAGAAALILWRWALPEGLLLEAAGLALGAGVYVLALKALGIDPEERHVLDRIRARLPRARRGAGPA